jgi:hypothetical protein
MRHPRQMLLLLDNCEHVLAAAGDLVATLLAACPAYIWGIPAMGCHVFPAHPS